MAAVTVQDIIYQAAGYLGMKGSGKNISGEDNERFFNYLNMMTDSWGAERQLCYTVQRFTYPLIVGQQIYPIGPTAPAPFTQPRPITIQSWGVILSGGDPQLEITRRRVLTADEYNALRLKTLQNAFPLEIYYDYAAPNGNVILYPVTSAGGNTLVLYIPQAMPYFANLTDEVFTGPVGGAPAIPNFPPGYWMLLTTNLAVIAADGFGRPVPETTAAIAARTMAKLKSRNVYVPSLKIDIGHGAAGRPWDYLTDDYIYGDR